mmetsp:Transcript_20929/g.35031  ORF Transcript_20929/g.35031 Transcript_20929/m.35031 type:complete len:157 (+) Transcript_20929:210-680(+)
MKYALYDQFASYARCTNVERLKSAALQIQLPQSDWRCSEQEKIELTSPIFQVACHRHDLDSSDSSIPDIATIMDPLHLGGYDGNSTLGINSLPGGGISGMPSANGTGNVTTGIPAGLATVINTAKAPVTNIFSIDNDEASKPFIKWPRVEKRRFVE